MYKNKHEFKLALIEARIRHLTGMQSLASVGWLFSEIHQAEDKGFIAEAYATLDESLGDGVKIANFTSGLMLILLVREVEYYLADVLKHICLRYPKRLSGTEIPLSKVIDVPVDEIVSEAAEKYLNQLLYKKPEEYLLEICEIASIDHVELQSFWPLFVEAKARRDLGIHNNWTVNKVYLRKISNLGIECEMRIGDSAIPDDAYLHSAYDNGSDLIERFHDLLIKKHD